MPPRAQTTHKPSIIYGARTFLLVSAVVALAVVSPMSPAAAAPGASADIVIYKEPGVVEVSIPDPAIRSKKAAATTLGPVAALTPPGGVGDNSAAHCYNNLLRCQFNIHKTANRTITPPGGASGGLTSTGTAFVDAYRGTALGTTITQADYYTTTSSSYWGGSTPFNCTSVKHQDVWDIDYTALSWSYGGSPTGTASFGSGRIGYENTVSNTWKVTHSVQHVFLRVSGGWITQIRYEAHGSFQFGSAFFTTDANSRVALP